MERMTTVEIVESLSQYREAAATTVVGPGDHAKGTLQLNDVLTDGLGTIRSKGHLLLLKCDFGIVVFQRLHNVLLEFWGYTEVLCEMK